MSGRDVTVVQIEVFFTQFWYHFLQGYVCIVFQDSPESPFHLEETDRNSDGNTGSAGLAVGPINMTAAASKANRRQYGVEVLVDPCQWISKQRYCLLALEVAAVMDRRGEKTQFGQ